MSDGKRVLKSDVVCVSIKPQRPEYSPEKKHVPVKILLQEWDKLDCYYRGQILKLKKKVKSASGSSETRKSSNKSSSSHGGGHNHKNNKSSSAPRRRSTSGHQLTELFGDENLPSDNDLDVEDPNHRGSDEENKQPRPQERHRSSSRKHRGGDGKITKSEKNKSSELSKPQQPAGQEAEDNFLSVPRDNFVIEFAIGEKKRTPVRIGPDPPGFISPVRVEPYKPPVAIGFNVVHIQKILYHSGSVLQHTSPTTTTANTPEKPPNIQPTSPTLLINNNNNGDRNSTGNKSSSSSSYGLGGMDNGSQQKVTFQGSNSIKGTTTGSSSFIKNNGLSSSKLTTANDDDDNAITSTSLPTKRKSEHRSVPETINNIYKYNNATTTATTTMTGDLTSPPNNKKPATDKDYSLLLREKMPPPPPPVIRKAVTEIRQHPQTNGIHPSSPPLKSGVSITDKIIKKAKDLPPELKEREKRRKLESQKRRAYAHQKTQEQYEMDSVDVSLKAMEMIWNLPLLSPIRSP